MYKLKQIKQMLKMKTRVMDTQLLSDTVSEPTSVHMALLQD